MVTLSQFKLSLFLLVSLTPMVRAEGDTVIFPPAASNDSPDHILLSLTRSIKPLESILRTIISAAFIHECEQQKLDEMNAVVHAPRIDTSLTSTTKNNRMILVDRIRRFVFGREPKIIITSTTILNEHDHSLEGEITNIIKAKMFELAKNEPSLCNETKDANGNVLTCRIVYTLKEFNKLKEYYNSMP